jgi:monoamine oxidase
MATRERIAIVGAGAAGAEAARVLTALGLEVIVIEARERIGGRIDTRREDDGTTFELGAWQLASDAAGHILAEAGSVALEGVVEVTAAGKASRGSIAELNAVQSDVSARLDQWASADSTEDSGLARALTDSGASAAAGTVGDIPPEAMRALYIEAVRLASGAEPADVSAWFPPPEIGAASVIPTGGLDSIVAAGLDGATVALSTAVVAVAYNDDGVSLRLGTGESRRVDRVILTLPLGVLKADAVEFEPPLPLSVRSSIDAVDVGHIEIVRVAFDEAFWTTKAAIWNLLGSDAPISTWINLQPLTGQTVLLGIAAGDAAASFSDVDDAALSLMVREMLAPFAA